MLPNRVVILFVFVGHLPTREVFLLLKTMTALWDKIKASKHLKKYQVT